MLGIRQGANSGHRGDSHCVFVWITQTHNDTHSKHTLKTHCPPLLALLLVKRMLCHVICSTLMKMMLMALYYFKALCVKHQKVPKRTYSPTYTVYACIKIDLPTILPSLKVKVNNVGRGPSGQPTCTSRHPHSSQLSGSEDRPVIGHAHSGLSPCLWASNFTFHSDFHVSMLFGRLSRWRKASL